MKNEDDFGVLGVVDLFFDDLVADTHVFRGVAPVSLEKTFEDIKDDSRAGNAKYNWQTFLIKGMAYVLLWMPRIGRLKVTARRLRLLCIQ